MSLKKQPFTELFRFESISVVNFSQSFGRFINWLFKSEIIKPPVNKFSYAGTGIIYNQFKKADTLYKPVEIPSIVFTSTEKQAGNKSVNPHYRLRKLHSIGSITNSATVISFTGNSINSYPLEKKMNLAFKRFFDIIVSLFILIFVLSWLIPIIAILIKLESKGPVFFKQLRSGLDNKPFWCYKFRSMVVNNESDERQATTNDKRLTKVGLFLRKTSLDEFPQFLNVLKGDMSLIGPRPHPIKLNEKFEPLITNIMSRHYVKPGITGLAQCMGYRGETQTLADMENRVRLDRYYIENWTFWLDIKIIFLTVISLIRGSDKAY